jgi:predicted DCC family thiol-disulfide oxidoreductase YuxK
MARKDYPVLLVDSECAVCNRSVRFIREHLRKKEKLLFRSLFTDEGKKYLRKYNLPEDYNDSLVLIENGRAYLKSDGVLRIARKLGGLYPLLYGFIIIPAGIRDFFYSLFARHRHVF